MPEHHPHHHHSHGHSHSHSHNHDDTSFHQEPLYNLTGAVLFYSYIFLALLFTGMVTLRLRKRYLGLCASHPEPGGSRLTIPFLGTLSLVSFATLSYHMLRVLITSYTSFATHNLRPISHLARIHLFSGTFLPTPTSLLDFLTEVAAQIWHWSVSSSLFLSFAQDLVRNQEAQLWSLASLLGGLVWAVWMGDVAWRKGGVVGGVGVGWYFGLSQILPGGFAGMLFVLGVVLKPDEGDGDARGEEWWW